MMKSVIWWRKPEYPEETTDLRQVTDETFHTQSWDLLLKALKHTHGYIHNTTSTQHLPFILALYYYTFVPDIIPILHIPYWGSPFFRIYTLLNAYTLYIVVFGI